MSIKLWDWDKKWQSIQVCKQKSYCFSIWIIPAKFNRAMESMFTNHLFVSMGEIFSENFSFIAPLEFQGLSENFQFANFFNFQELLLSDSFCCQSYWSYFLNLDQEQFQTHLEQKVEGHLIDDNYEFSSKKCCRKWCSWSILQFFSSLGVYQSVAKHSRYLIFTNIKELYDKLPKHLIQLSQNFFDCFSRRAENGRNAKIAKISYFF